MFGLAGDGIEVIREIHAETGGVDGAIDEAAEFTGVVHDGENFLHAPEGEDGDKEGAAPSDGVIDGGDEASDLVDAFLADRARGGAAGRFGDNGVEVAGGEAGAGKGALILKQNVAGEEDAAVLVLNFDGGGAGDMTGAVEGDREFVFLASEVFGLVVGEADKAGFEAVDLGVAEEGAAREFALFFLAEHDAGGVSQHALEDDAAGERHEHGGVWVLAHGDG